MPEDSRAMDLWDRLAAFVISGACIFIDGLFMALWVLVQWVVSEYVVKPIQPYGIHWLSLLVFQVVLGISTLAVVLVYTYEDISVMIIRAHRRVTGERNRVERSDPGNGHPKGTPS